MALDTLRKGAARTLGLILVGLLVISFAIWGIADIFTGYGRQTLIRVGDTEITSQDYLRAQQEVLRAMSSQAGRSLSLQEARALGLDSRVLERLVGERIARGHVHAWLDQPNTTVLEPTERHWDILGRMLHGGQAAGNLVPDAHLAALAVEHGATLCSTDHDFSRFAGLKWHNPLAHE